MRKAKRHSTQREARHILAGLRLSDGNLAGQVTAASDNVLAVMMALMWLSAGWIEVDGTFRELFVRHYDAWLAEIKPSKRDPTSAVIEACQAIDATMRIMGFEPTPELIAQEARAKALAEAELRRRGFFDESLPLELV